MDNNSKSGKLITFSGIDGSGKSTLSKLVYNYYKDQFPSALQSGFGNKIFTKELERIANDLNQEKRSLFSEYICNIAWLGDLAYNAFDMIIPLLNNGVTVFVDRYYLCAKVYSMATTEQRIDRLFSLYECLPKPDICFYLMVDPKVAMNRIMNRGKKRVYYETEDFLTKIRHTYDVVIPNENYRIETIQASHSAEESLVSVIEIIDQMISKS